MRPRKLQPTTKPLDLRQVAGELVHEIVAALRAGGVVIPIRATMMALDAAEKKVAALTAGDANNPTLDTPNGVLS